MEKNPVSKDIDDSIQKAAQIPAISEETPIGSLDELGGKNPQIVFPDASTDKVIDGLFQQCVFLDKVNHVVLEHVYIFILLFFGPVLLINR